MKFQSGSEKSFRELPKWKKSYKIFILSSQQPYHRWYSERQINAKTGQEKSSRSTKMDSETMLASFSLSNSSSSISKSTYSTCNLQLNSNSNANSSISNNLVGNDGVTNQHTMMKTNNIVSNTSDCNKVQLVSNPNLSSLFVSEANGRNVNEESIKDENIANYKNSHLIDDSQKFNLNNKHIPCQRDSQNNHYTQMMNDINASSMPLNLCQVSVLVSVFK